MKKRTFIVTFCLIVTMFSLLFSPLSLAKKRCKTFQKKLHDVQAMQRSSYSLKRGNSLRTKEDKARDKWWDCERLSLAKFNDKYGSKKKKKKSKKTSTKSKDKKVTKNKTATQKHKVATYSQQQSTRFNQYSTIIIKSKYQGDKRLAWLAFYKKPIKCQQPKSMSVFVYCSEDKVRQQSEFDNTYRD